MFRTGFGYDSHRLIEGKPLIIGGVQIEYSKGCLAHSDGDVLIHSLCDALFGAAGLKDIGTHFPDTDPQYKNISSLILLQETVKLIQQEGFTVINTDMTILLEKPKLMPYIDLIREKLSMYLQISLAEISVKAKTNEKMGFIGQEEGIVAMTMVMIEKR
jgi:2-C-methyl-D-erythritol 2,4-cyclodiphosphate synthase